MHRHPLEDLEYLKAHWKDKYREIEDSPEFAEFAKTVHEARAQHQKVRHGTQHRLPKGWSF